MYHLIEKSFGSEHNVQFVCLAFQNAMTTQINGQQSIQRRALHEIIINEGPQGKQGKEGTASWRYTQCRVCIFVAGRLDSQVLLSERSTSDAHLSLNDAGLQ